MSLLRTLLFVALLAACGSPTREAPRPLPVPTSSPPKPNPPPAPSTSAEAQQPGTPPPEPVVAGRRLRVVVEPRSFLLTEPGTAPCDFQRLYRGGVGKQRGAEFATPMSAMLTRDTHGGLSGTIHYDRVGSAMAIAGGKVEPDHSFEINEKGGGTFVGKCDRAGELRGTFSFRGKTEPFTWFPRPTTWPALFQIERTKQVKTCKVSDTSIRYFGGSAAVNRVVNLALDSGSFANHMRDVDACRDESSHESHSVVLFAADDVLTVQHASSSDWGGAHPVHSAGGSGTTVDLRNGKRVALGDIVTSIDRLRAYMPDCLRDYLSVDAWEPGDVAVAFEPSDVVCDYPFSNYLWDCDKTAKSAQPTWALVEGGIAILATGHAHVESYRDGSGPIISWAALQRDGVLKPKSPVARLWQNTAPAAADAPACVAAHGGNRMLRWTVLSPD